MAILNTIMMLATNVKNKHSSCEKQRAWITGRLVDTPTTLLKNWALLRLKFTISEVYYGGLLYGRKMEQMQKGGTIRCLLK